jgi:hypothetical protein
VATPSRDAGPPLRGRRSECDVLRHVVAGILAGGSRALVLRGEAGVGKTALLEYLATQAPQCRVLPAASRELLLVAAAEPVGDPLTVWHAAELLGIGADAAGPASSAALVEFAGRVRFRHPLVRSAVYRSSEPADRVRVHRALAEATDAGTEPDRRAWHLAQVFAKLGIRSRHGLRDALPRSQPEASTRA